MKPILALEYLKDVVNFNKELKHYKRRVELAQEYFDYYTGNLEKRLQRIISRESEKEFEQRQLITSHITKSILNSAKLPFYKASRKLPFKKIDFDSTNSDTRRKLLETYISVYNGDKSLDSYLELMFVEYNFIDPNAFLIVEFLSNDETERAKPYPFIAKSDQVIDYNYINGILEYLVIRMPIKFIENDKEKDGHKYTMYNGNETFVFEQVAKNDKKFSPDNYYITNDDKKFLISLFNVKAKADPELIPACIQFGYILDPETNYETYLSVFDCALPYLKKTLKNNSELDQAMAMTAFPERYRYVPGCSNEGCFKGKMPDGKDCPACGGTGKASAHKGTQDIFELELPRDLTEIIGLEKLSATKSPQIELLKFLDEYIRQLKVDVHTTIFNSDVFTKPTVSTTATEKLLDTDNMNDALRAFCNRYSQVWKFNVYFIAVFTDNVKVKNGDPDIILTHKFPNDLKLKSLSELMTDLKTAYDSNASMSTISAIEADINEILYADRPDDLKKINIQQMFYPFNGMSQDDIRYYISSNLVSKFNQVLAANYSNIWNDLEREGNIWIYDLEPPKIWDLLTKKVNKLIDGLKEEQPEPIMRADFNSIETSDIQNNEVSVFYDEQIQINFRTNNKNISKDNDLIIVPVVLMTEGVHIGSHGSILHKISELGKIPTAWNGIPITINHPKKDGKYVSANMPDIISSLIVGRIYNTKVDDNKLISEAWIERSKLIDLSPDILIDIETGNEIEVSIGAFPEYKNISGNWNGEEYDSIAVNYRPDHLAILPDMKGACSTEDGAGINVNGGKGSGNFGHEGRPGEVGGSGGGGSFEELIKIYGTKEEAAKHLKDDVDKDYYKAKQMFEKNGYVVSVGGDSHTDFGHSRYMYVNDPNNLSNDNLGNGLKVRISDHSVENTYRIKEEIHVEAGNEKSLIRASKQIDYYFKSNLFKKEDFLYNETSRLNVPTKALLKTDKIISTRISKKSGNETNEIERIFKKKGTKIIDTRDGFILDILYR